MLRIAGSLYVEARLLTQIFNTSSQLRLEECFAFWLVDSAVGGTKHCGRLGKSDVVVFVLHHECFCSQHLQWSQGLRLTSQRQQVNVMAQPQPRMRVEWRRQPTMGFCSERTLAAMNNNAAIPARLRSAESI